MEAECGLVWQQETPGRFSPYTFVLPSTDSLVLFSQILPLVTPQIYESKEQRKISASPSLVALAGRGEK